MLDYETLNGMSTERKLSVMLVIALRLIAKDRTECNGYKCREPNCASCNSDESVDEHIKQVEEFCRQSMGVLKEIK